MGAEQSKFEDGRPKQAFQVLRVDENSPAAKAKLSPYFDYIVSVNGVEILQEIPNVVAEMAKNHIERPMKMAVYNSRQDAIREVSIIPSRQWGGKTLLGASIRYCVVTDVADRVWHIADLVPNSPADNAGLIPLKDWIIGSPDIAINTNDDFYNLMIHNQKRPVRLLVFNIDREYVREISVTPDFEWGGDGCLGCDVASGALHRIPPLLDTKLNNTVELPTTSSTFASTTILTDNTTVTVPTTITANTAPTSNYQETELTVNNIESPTTAVEVNSPLPTLTVDPTLKINPTLRPIPGFQSNQASTEQDLSFLQ